MHSRIYDRNLNEHNEADPTGASFEARLRSGITAVGRVLIDLWGYR